MKIRTRVINSIRDIIEILEEFERYDEDIEEERENNIAHLDFIDELQCELDDKEHRIHLLEENYDTLENRYLNLKELYGKLCEQYEVPNTIDD